MEFMRSKMMTNQTSKWINTTLALMSSKFYSGTGLVNCKVTNVSKGKQADGHHQQHHNQQQKESEQKVAPSKNSNNKTFNYKQTTHTHTHTHSQHTHHTKHFDFCFLLPAAVFCLWKLAPMTVRTLCESLPLSLRQSAPDVLMLLDQCSVSGSCPCTMWKKMTMLEIHTIATPPPPPKNNNNTHKNNNKTKQQGNTVEEFLFDYCTITNQAKVILEEEWTLVMGSFTWM